MEYQGYTAVVEFDDEAGVFHGAVRHLRDVITFEGTSVEELRQAFRDSVDDYVEFCARRGKEPDRPYSGPPGAADGSGPPPRRRNRGLQARQEPELMAGRHGGSGNCCSNAERRRRSEVSGAGPRVVVAARTITTSWPLDG